MEDKVFLPKIGWVRFRKSREIHGTIKQAKIVKEADHWYICFSCELEKQKMLGFFVISEALSCTTFGYETPSS